MPRERPRPVARCLSAPAAKVCAALRARASRPMWSRAVRDLLLGIVPKDYDIAPTPGPSRSSRSSAGADHWARFRLVHVMFGSDTIEVSTFRAPTRRARRGRARPRAARQRLRLPGGGRAAARLHGDALYFDPVSEEVSTSHGGWPTSGAPAARDRRPQTRSREDPVRMLRAVRLARSSA